MHLTIFGVMIYISHHASRLSHCNKSGVMIQHADGKYGAMRESMPIQSASHIVFEKCTVSSPACGHFAHCIICYHMSVSVPTDQMMVS